MEEEEIVVEEEIVESIEPVEPESVVDVSSLGLDNETIIENQNLIIDELSRTNDNLVAILEKLHFVDSSLSTTTGFIVQYGGLIIPLIAAIYFFSAFIKLFWFRD